MLTASASSIPDIGELIRPDRIHRSVYSDQVIFELEMCRIFEKTWVYVAHESELRMPGDYKTAYIGLQPVILARTEDGRLTGLFNRCTYRAWTFKNTGELIGVPRRDRYPPDFDPRDFDAVKVPRLESYRGFVFASMNPEVEPIADYLAQARRWLDAQIDLSIEGTVSLSAGAHRHTYHGNWKLQAENGVDGYHAVYLHETYFNLRKMHGRESDRFGP